MNARQRGYLREKLWKVIAWNSRINKSHEGLKSRRTALAKTLEWRKSRGQKGNRAESLAIFFEMLRQSAFLTFLRRRNGQGRGGEGRQVGHMYNLRGGIIFTVVWSEHVFPITMRSMNLHFRSILSPAHVSLTQLDIERCHLEWHSRVCEWSLSGSKPVKLNARGRGGERRDWIVRSLRTWYCNSG